MTLLYVNKNVLPLTQKTPVRKVFLHHVPGRTAVSAAERKRPHVAQTTCKCGLSNPIFHCICGASFRLRTCDQITPVWTDFGTRWRRCLGAALPARGSSVWLVVIATGRHLYAATCLWCIWREKNVVRHVENELSGCEKCRRQRAQTQEVCLGGRMCALHPLHSLQAGRAKK